MKNSLVWICLIAAAGFTLPAGAAAAGSQGAVRREACWDEDRPARVWPEILFEEGADLADYRRTMSQSRDEVRAMLTQEFIEVLKELAPVGGSPKEIAEAALSAVMALDEAHDRHKEAAGKGLATYLEAGFRSALDDEARFNRVPVADRRLRFVSPGLVERFKGAVSDMKLARSPNAAHSTGRFLSKADVETLRQVADTVDLIPYATYSSDGGRLQLTLTLENVRSGAMCGFEAAGDVKEVASVLAQEVFQDFQAMGYPAAKNPGPHLAWIPPPIGAPAASAERARNYCASQGSDVRLPYALELTAASDVGGAGASYVEGGISRLTPGPWIVADRLQEDAQYYYFQPAPGNPDNDPAGAIRTSAGLGRVSARYWCVKGEPGERVTRVERLYEQYRAVKRTDPHAPALAAFEYLAGKEGALGAREFYAQAFADADAAWAAIEAAGCSVAKSRAGASEGTVAVACAIRKP